MKITKEKLFLKKVRSVSVFFLFFSALFFQCGGAEISLVQTTEKTTNRSADGISIIRNSLKEMGTLERIRLKEGRVQMVSKVSSDGVDFTVKTMLGGNNRCRLKYVDYDSSFFYNKNACLKEYFSVPMQCDMEEMSLVEPTQIFNSLVFPTKDPAGLDLSYKFKKVEHYESKFGQGECSLVRIYSRQSNLRFFACYDVNSKLLVTTRFFIRDSEGEHEWIVSIGDYQYVNKIKVPFSRTYHVDDKLIWSETAAEITFDNHDERDFQPQSPPGLLEPRKTKLPARRALNTVIQDIPVQMPALFPALGGAYPKTSEIINLPPFEGWTILQEGPLGQVEEIKKKLSETQGYSSTPGVMLFEKPQIPDDSVLFMVY